MSSLLRGQVVLADIGLDEPKRFVVVSNNLRNKALPSVLAVRVTASRKPPMDSIVELAGCGESQVGRVVCDDITVIWEDEVVTTLSALTPATMRLIDAGLHAALGLVR